MTAEPLIARMEGLTLPPGIARRDPPARVREPTTRFWEGYDADTIAYCAIHDRTARRISLFGPPALNLSALIRRGRFEIGSARLPEPRQSRKGRFDRWDLPFDGPAGALRLTLSGCELQTDLCLADEDHFAGRRVLYTMSRDNDLDWVRDWLLWHVKRHGCDAVLIADNNTKAYSPGDLAETLALVHGVRRVAVISVPYRYGPAAGSAINASAGEFLQVAVLNALWMRWLRRARAMLNLDVDELLDGSRCPTVFDACERSWTGITMFRGAWRHPAKVVRAVRHADHVFIREGDKPCPPKYALRPGSLAAGFALKVHSVGPFRNIPGMIDRRFSFLHCRGISTSWKQDRSTDSVSHLVEDDRTRDSLKELT